MIRNTIKWFESAALDAPELKSPQPCPQGVYCDYRVMTRSGDLLPGCCRGVHPGEEGTGRRLFRARQVKETGPEAIFYVQPACVRLIGADRGYYQRRRLRLSWREWCVNQGIPYIPGAPGQQTPVTRSPLGRNGLVKITRNTSYLQLNEAQLRFQMAQMEEMSPNEPIHGRPASAFLPPTLLRQHLPDLTDDNELDMDLRINEITSQSLNNQKLSFDPQDILLAARLISMEEGMPMRIRVTRWTPDDERTGHTPEALDKSEEKSTMRLLIEVHLE